MNAIELTHVPKTFNGGAVVAVDDVSLAIEEGDCFGLIGPNGSGKTTSFGMICGFLRPTTGSLQVMGQDPWQPGAVKRKVGVLPQDSVLPFGCRVGWLLTYWAKLSGLPNPEREARGARASERCRTSRARAWTRRSPRTSAT